MDLVNLFWTEAHSDLNEVLKNQVRNYSITDISKAEGILLQIKKMYPNKEKMSSLSKEFYKIIQHKESEEENCPIDNLRVVSEKFDLCQVYFYSCLVWFYY